MIVRGLSELEICRGVTRVPNAKITHITRQGKGFRVKLSVRSTEDGNFYYRRSPTSGHRVAALCWHGFREVIREWYRLNPKAVIISVHARYESSSHFEHTHKETGRRNIGSQLAPQAYEDACDC